MEKKPSDLRIHNQNVRRAFRRYLWKPYKSTSTGDLGWKKVKSFPCLIFNMIFKLVFGFAGWFGARHGNRDDLFRAVKRKKLCRIKINGVSPKNSVGMIIPLFGNPVELRKFKSFDLVHL